MKKSFWMMFVLLPLLMTDHAAFAEDYAEWQSLSGDWHTTTNWADVNDVALPSPGYPTTNFNVWIGGGCVTISSQDVSIATLQLKAASILTVTNGYTLTVTNSVNYQPADAPVGFIAIPNGNVNLLNVQTGTIYGLYFDVGTNGTSGYLDLGSIWGTTNGFPANFGSLDYVLISVTNGGLRVDANSITFQDNSGIRNYGQDVTFGGDWLNADGTTVFMVNGNGTGTISIAGNFSFGGCKLYETIDANGVNLIQVGGDATLTNAVLTIGATDGLTNPAASYDLVRVPAAKTIYTNGMTFCVASSGGFTYTAAIETNRSGYDYLVITPGQFLPSVTITNPADEAFYTAVTNITVQAAAFARSGSITKVEFYADTTKIGEKTNAPYSVTWTNVYAGYYEVKAVATDSNGHQGLSPSIGLNVQGTKADGRKVFITGGAVITYDPGCAE